MSRRSVRGSVMRVESFNGALVITLLVIGLILIIGSQIASVRAGAAGLFAKAGSLLSPLGALGARLAGSSGVKLALLAVPLFLGMGLGLKECGRREGRLQERVAQAEEALRDTRAIGEAAIEEGQGFRRDADKLRSGRDEGRAEIQEASLHETDALFLAWAQSDRRVCDAAGGCGNHGS